MHAMSTACTLEGRFCMVTRNLFRMNIVERYVYIYSIGQKSYMYLVLALKASILQFMTVNLYYIHIHLRLIEVFRTFN